MLQLNEQLNRPVVVITGHYGCGKTSFALSLAECLAGMGKAPSLVDLDIVNPYFRSFDYRQELKGCGIQVEGPVYAGMNLDIPALPAHIDGMIEMADLQHPVILDVGGDDAGAAALGRYHPVLQRLETAGRLTVLGVVSFLRPLTETPESAVQALSAIQAASRLQCTGVVNATNLGSATDVQLVLGNVDKARQTAQMMALPVASTVLLPDVWQQMSSEEKKQIPFPFVLSRRVMLPWENGKL